MLEIKDLSFLDIIEDINVTFENGHVYLITGENGCGKTVFFKCILGLLKKTTGTVLVDGISVDSNPKLKKQLGALVEDPDFLSWNSGIDNLRYLASINGKMNEELVYDLLKKSKYVNSNNLNFVINCVAASIVPIFSTKNLTFKLGFLQAYNLYTLKVIKT